MTHISSLGARVLGALWLTALASLTQAQDTAPAQGVSNTEVRIVARDWLVTCRPTADSTALACEGVRELHVQGTDQVFVTLFLTRLGDKGNASTFLRLQLPHGVDLPAGITLGIDGSPVARPVARTSTSAGLFARAPLTTALAQQLRAGESLEITFASLDGQSFSLRTELQGIAAVHDMVAGR